jgi:hexosaminidase
MKKILVLLLLLSVAEVQAQTFDVNSLALQWEVIENSHQGKSQFLSAFTIHNKSDEPLVTSGWSLYFNFVRQIRPESVGNGFAIEHLNGDLYRLFASTSSTIAAGEKIEIPFVSADWVVNFTDAPTGLFVVFDLAKDAGIAIKDYTIKPSTQPNQYLRFPGDKVGLTTPEKIYQQNDSIRIIDPRRLTKVFPAPVSYSLKEKGFTITNATTIECVTDFSDEAEYLASSLRRILGKKPLINGEAKSTNGVIRLRKGETEKEGYTLSISPAGIDIVASTPAGVFYGIQSLLTAIDPPYYSKTSKSIVVAGLEVKDHPRFEHRAFFLDVCRNFHTKEEVLKLLDLMALYKLNVLHLHLTDDEGWRIEIDGLPELTEVGSQRGYSSNSNVALPPSFGSGPVMNTLPGSGFYSRKDYIEILRYAKARHIVVIPEVEMPGHARAAVKSMDARYERLMKQGMKAEAEKYLLHHPEDQSTFRSVQGWNDNVIDPALPSTYTFLEKVFDEIVSMHKEAGATLETIHCGGDEVPAGVWEKSPACVQLMNINSAIKKVDDLWYYFYDRVNTILKERKLFLYGWEEVAMRKTTLDGKGHYIPNPDFVGRGIQVDVWNNVLGWGAEDLAYRLANSGYKVVLSCVSHLYFDMAYYKSFEEPGYYWGGFTDVDKPFSFIPYDYFKNSSEDKFGGPLDRSVFIGKERLTEYGRQNIIGIQGLLWSENIVSPQRLEYMILPKLLGLAERAWSPDPSWATLSGSGYKEAFRTSWSEFVNVVGTRELPRLDYYAGGFNYRIPSPGISAENGVIKTNIQLPGLTLRYTTDGSEPGVKSPVYTGPVKATGVFKVRAFNTRGRGGNTSKVN